MRMVLTEVTEGAPPLEFVIEARTIRTRQEFLDILNRQRAVVKFIKKGNLKTGEGVGRLRVMYCTRNLEYVPREFHPHSSYRGPPNVLPVFDLVKKDWRSFRIGSVKTIEPRKLNFIDRTFRQNRYRDDHDARKMGTDDSTYDDEFGNPGQEATPAPPKKPGILNRLFKRESVEHEAEFVFEAVMVPPTIKSFKELVECPVIAEKKSANKTLYVSRKLAPHSAKELFALAERLGVQNPLPVSKMHLTVAASKTEVDHSTLTPDEGEVTARFLKISYLGDGKRAVVAVVDAKGILQNRWDYYQARGASCDYKSYIAHVTLSYDSDKVDLSEVPDEDIEVTFKGEVIETFNGDWKSTINEALTRRYHGLTQGILPRLLGDHSADDLTTPWRDDYVERTGAPPILSEKDEALTLDLLTYMWNIVERDIDPEKGKFTPWIMDRYLKIQTDSGGARFYGIRYWEDMDRTRAALAAHEKLRKKQFFKQNPQHAHLADINAFKKLTDLEAFITLNTPKEPELDPYDKFLANGGITEIYKGPEGYVIQLNTVEASVALFQGPTRWCTARPGNGHFASYIARGPLYVAFSADAKDNSRYVQVHMATRTVLGADDEPLKDNHSYAMGTVIGRKLFDAGARRD